MICPCSVYGGLYPTHVSIKAVLISALSHTYQTGRSLLMLLGGRGLVGGCLTWDIHAVFVAPCKDIESTTVLFSDRSSPVFMPYIGIAIPREACDAEMGKCGSRNACPGLGPGCLGQVAKQGVWN